MKVRNFHQDSLSLDATHLIQLIPYSARKWKEIINACFVVSMSSSSCPTMTNPPSDSSSTMAEAEVEEHEAILKDLSNSDTNSDDTKKRSLR